MDLIVVLSLGLLSVIFVSGAITDGYISYIIAMIILVFFLSLLGWLFIYKPFLTRKILFGPLKKFYPAIDELATLMKQNPKQLLLMLGVCLRIDIEQ